MVGRGPSIRGPGGAVIYFHRSAAWCIYCRAQLVQLEESQEAIRRNGLAVVAISFDGAPALREFAREKKITFPLLSDPRSKTIRDFKVLDTSVRPDNPAYGVPYHGLYVVNDKGVVVSRFFEGGIGHSAGIVLTRLFGSPVNTHAKLVKYDHLSLTYYANTDSVSAGDYAPITWDLGSSSAFSASPVEYPAPQVVSLPRMPEKLPIYRGAVRLSRLVTISPGQGTILSKRGPGGDLSIKGSFPGLRRNRLLRPAEHPIGLAAGARGPVARARLAVAPVGLSRHLAEAPPLADNPA